MNKSMTNQVPTRCTRKTLIVLGGLIAGTFALGLAIEFVPRVCVFLASQISIAASILSRNWLHWESVAPRVLFWSCWSITVAAAGLFGWTCCASNALEKLRAERRGREAQSLTGKRLAAVGAIALLVFVIGMTATGFSFGPFELLDSFRLAAWLVLVVLPPVVLWSLFAQAEESFDDRVIATAMIFTFYVFAVLIGLGCNRGL